VAINTTLKGVVTVEKKNDNNKNAPKLLMTDICNFNAVF
jgi:hypothetical protein